VVGAGGHIRILPHLNLPAPPTAKEAYNLEVNHLVILLQARRLSPELIFQRLHQWAVAPVNKARAKIIQNLVAQFCGACVVTFGACSRGSAVLMCLC